MSLETAESHNSKLTGSVKPSTIERFKERITHHNGMEIDENELQFLLESIEKVGRVEALDSASVEELANAIRKRGINVKLS